jgi:hypothetical protein
MKRTAATLTAFGFAVALSGCAGAYNADVSAATAPSSSMVAGPGAGPADQNPYVPGATGRAIVPGDSSTISGDAAATLMQRTGRV